VKDVKALSGRKLAVSFHVRGRDRADDLARQGAADLIRFGARRGREGDRLRTNPRFRSRRRRGSSSMRST
jgi:hypothetical protein